MDINTEIKTRAQRIEDIIAKFIPEKDSYQQTVIEAMRYSFLAGGKRLRPMLMEETYKLFGGDGQVVYPFMAALEMIHTYSLIHDDLPAMDNDDYRRGRLTSHKVYGEAMAILAGDALLNFAFETAISAFDIDPSNTQIPQALKVLGKNAGIYGMIGGQVADVESEGQQISKDKLDYIFINKTGALIESAMLIGAILAGADKEDQEKISRVANLVGYAFQIQDDILDVVGDAQLLGKPIGSDDRNDKSTYVSLYGLEEAKKAQKEMSEEAMELLNGLGRENEFLTELIRSLTERKM